LSGQPLDLAGAAIVRETSAAARQLRSAAADEIVIFAATHSTKLHDYFAVRWLLCNGCRDAHDMFEADCGIF